MPSEHILVAVGAVIEDDKGRILLVKHKKERGGYWQEKWICPGGELEFGEEIKEGIKREVKEETNLEIELVRPLVPFDRIVKLDERTSLRVKRRFLDVANLHEDTQSLLKIAGIV